MRLRHWDGKSLFTSFSLASGNWEFQDMRNGEVWCSRVSYEGCATYLYCFLAGLSHILFSLPPFFLYHIQITHHHQPLPFYNPHNTSLSPHHLPLLILNHAPVQQPLRPLPQPLPRIPKSRNP